MTKFLSWPSSRRTRRLPELRAFSRPMIELLEDRVVLSSGITAVGADTGSAPVIKVYDQATGGLVRSIMAFDSSFTGGVRVAVADVNGDGTPDVIAGAGPGGGPQVRVFDGTTGQALAGPLGSFFAMNAGFRGGVFVAGGDVDGDGKSDVIVSADKGGGPQVSVFSALGGSLMKSFYSFAASFTGGSRIASADVNGDGKADIVAGAGPGGGPQVTVFDGVTGNVLQSVYALASSFTGGIYVAAADLNADGKADFVAGAGPGGGPQVTVFDGVTANLLTSFFAYAPNVTSGVRVGAYSLDSAGLPGILTAPGSGIAGDVRIFDAIGGSPAGTFTPFTGLGGLFVNGAGLPGELTQLSGGTLGNFFNPPSATGNTLLNLQLDPLNVDLLGLQVQTSPITVTMSVAPGSGQLLGNLLSSVNQLINIQGFNDALNGVLHTVVGLVNNAGLVVNGAITSGPFSDPDPSLPSTTPVLDLFVAPVHLNLLGAKVDTSPITVRLQVHTGQGLILGNALTQVAHLFDGTQTLDLNTINQKLQDVLALLNQHLPESQFPSAPTAPPSTSLGAGELLRLSVAPIDLNLLGLQLQTTQIQVNADSRTGSGLLLGNVLNALFNSLNATPESRAALNNNLNAILAKVVGVLNHADLLVPQAAVDALTPVLKLLALNTLTTAPAGDSLQVLDLTVASPDGTSPPVDVNLLGLTITTSNIHAQLFAHAGDGQLLGNLVYNLAHLLDGAGVLNVFTVLGRLGL